MHCVIKDPGDDTVLAEGFIRLIRMLRSKNRLDGRREMDMKPLVMSIVLRLLWVSYGINAHRNHAISIFVTSYTGIS
jgi:hypothetical protein